MVETPPGRISQPDWNFHQKSRPAGRGSSLAAMTIEGVEELKDRIQPDLKMG